MQRETKLVRFRDMVTNGFDPGHRRAAARDRARAGTAWFATGRTVTVFEALLQYAAFGGGGRPHRVPDPFMSHLTNAALLVYGKAAVVALTWISVFDSFDSYHMSNQSWSRITSNMIALCTALDPAAYAVRPVDLKQARERIVERFLPAEVDFYDDAYIKLLSSWGDFQPEAAGIKLGAQA